MVETAAGRARRLPLVGAVLVRPTGVAEEDRQKAAADWEPVVWLRQSGPAGGLAD